jgi:hypothetical protein
LKPATPIHVLTAKGPELVVHAWRMMRMGCGAGAASVQLAQILGGAGEQPVAFACGHASRILCFLTGSAHVVLALPPSLPTDPVMTEMLSPTAG